MFTLLLVTTVNLPAVTESKVPLLLFQLIVLLLPVLPPKMKLHNLLLPAPFTLYLPTPVSSINLFP